MKVKNPSIPEVSSITKTHYVVNGNKYDRITSVLDYFCSPDLVDWYIKEGKIAKSKSKTAKSVGTRVHNLCQDDYTTNRIKITENDSPAIANCMEAWKNWRSVEKPNIITMEKTVYSDEYKIAGTFDIQLSDRIIDIKTADSIKDNYWLQLAMYVYLYNMTTMNTIKTMSVLRLDKLTAEYEYKSRPFDMYYVNVYKGLLNYYRYCQEPEKIKEIDDVEVMTNPFDGSLI